MRRAPARPTTGGEIKGPSGAGQARPEADAPPARHNLLVRNISTPTLRTHGRRIGAVAIGAQYDGTNDVLIRRAGPRFNSDVKRVGSPVTRLSYLRKIPGAAVALVP